MTTFLAVIPAVWTETFFPFLSSALRPDSSLGLRPDEMLVVDNTRRGDLAALDYDWKYAGVRVYRDLANHNLGVAESWNIGAREVLAHGHDWLVIISTSMLFGPELHTTFRREVEAHPDAQIVECLGNSWHLIAIARSTLETVGLFDPWFHPGYEEAIDWGYRQKVLGLEALGWPRVWCNAMSIGHAVHIDRNRWDAPSVRGDLLVQRYVEKWGGPKGQERWVHPYNDPSKPLDWWETPFDPAEAARRYELEVWW